MNKPNKIYTLTIMYNDDTEEVEYLQETISVEESDPQMESPILIDCSHYWDDDTLELLKDIYLLAEA